MTGGYARPMPALGFDPTPGSVDLTNAMARRYGDAVGELDSILGTLTGLDLKSWRGEAADATRTRLAVIVSALRDTVTTAKDLHSVTSAWAGRLATFQSEAAALERQAESIIGEQSALTAKQKGVAAQNGARNPLIDQQLNQAGMDLSGIRGQARQLHEVYLATAAGLAKPVTIDDLWHDTEPIRKVLEVALAPFDIVAADHWLDVLKEIGGQPEELLEDADKAIAAASKLIDDGAPFAERVESLVEAGNALERGGSMLDAWTAFAPGWVKATASSLQGIEGLDDALGALGIAADAGTMISPANSGTLGDVDRGVAFVNGGLLVANMALDGIPVVGEVTLAATGIYLAGDFLYEHWTPFRDVAKTVGHAAVRVADDVGHWVGSLF
jgi:hypothetical protein